MRIAKQIATSLCLLALLVGSWLAPLDVPATQQVDAGLRRALVTFASARALNGAISVVQGTQIDAQPGGVGLTLAPGQLLAPINDLVKHFSNFMLMASVAFGIQKMLIVISSYWAISLVLTVTGAVWAGLYLRQQSPPSWISKMLILLLMLRFAIPIVVLGSSVLSEKFMAAEYAESIKSIDAATENVDGGKAVNGPSKWWKPPMPSIPNFEGMIEKMKQSADHIVKLMVIFLLQTLLIPLLLLWSMYTVVRSLFESPILPRSIHHIK